MYIVDGSARLATADANADDTVHPVVFHRSCFKDEARAQIVLMRLDVLAGGDPLHDGRQTMANASILDQKVMTVVEFDDQSNVGSECFISAGEQQIHAGDNAAIDLRASEMPGIQPIQSAAAKWSLTQHVTSRDFDPEFPNVGRFQFWHVAISMFWRSEGMLANPEAFA